MMGKAKMLGQFKPCIPKSKHYGSRRRSPWLEKPKGKNQEPATEKKEGKK